MSNEPLFTTRREFVSGGLTLLSAAATLPMFLGRTVSALAMEQPASRPAAASHPILVVVQLAGGNDGLNTVVPYTMDAYYKNRPRIAVQAKEVLKLESEVGLHPAAVGLKELYDEGKMAVIQGVGYPNPNRSHFTSMDIWHLADPQQRSKQGWLGRYFDACCTGTDPDAIDSIALMGEAPLALQGEKFMPLSFESPQALAWGAGRDRDAIAAFRKLNNMDGDVPAGGSALADYLQRAALKAQVGAEDIRTAAGSNLPRRRQRRRAAGGGGPLAQQLQLVARLIQAELPTRVYYVSMGGFDTHTNQQGRHQQLLSQFSEAMRDFIDTLEDHKLLDRVLVMTFSEFGRRVQENASGGTDHGEAAPMFLFGSKVIAGVHENHPSLEKLHRGDLAFGVDFRRVYATVLREWLKTDAKKILGGSLHPLRLLRR
jgi:uncharacterized protein (DUF1501 family)